MNPTSSLHPAAIGFDALQPLPEKVAEAKRRLPLPALMERRGLRDHAKPSAFCPFHENTRTKAFSIFQDAHGLWRWKCHSQCGGGDEITFLERLDGLPRSEATRQYLEAACVEPRLQPGLRSPSASTARQTPPPRPLPVFPAMENGRGDDLARLAKLRAVSPAALCLASSVGLLRFATLRGHRAWIITDDERLNAQARRLDGQPWEHIGAKAWTLPGAWASHPIGRQLAKTYPKIMLVEGGPDMLAALHFIIHAGQLCDWCPVAMLGASQRIPTSAFPIFERKRVRIFPHTDLPGRDAARVWALQLARAAPAKIDAFSFAGLRRANGDPVEDLNDCTTIDAAHTAQLKDLLP